MIKGFSWQLNFDGLARLVRRVTMQSSLFNESNQQFVQAQFFVYTFVFEKLELWKTTGSKY